MSKCLVIGRTVADVEECKALNLTWHPPAPSTLLFCNYDKFDGDIITAHTVKYGARWACSVEVSPRVFWSARNNPGRVVVGTSTYHRDHHVPEDVRGLLRFLYPTDYEYPTFNSGLFALWWALHCGYDEVYTVGIDLISIGYAGGYDEAAVTAYAHALDNGLPVGDFGGIEVSVKDEPAISAAAELARRYSGQKIYRASRVSDLPVPVKIPEGLTLAHGGK